MRLYVLMGFCEDYGLSERWIVGVYKTKKEAEDIAKKADEHVNILKDNIKEFQKKKEVEGYENSEIFKMVRNLYKEQKNPYDLNMIFERGCFSYEIFESEFNDLYNIPQKNEHALESEWGSSGTLEQHRSSD